MSTPTGPEPPADDIWAKPTREGQQPEVYPTPGDARGWSQGPRNGLGTAAVVLGALAVPGALLAGIGGILLGAIGLILGILGLRRARRGEATNRGAALAGTVLSSIGLLAGLAILGFLINYFRPYAECIDSKKYPTDASQRACVDRINEELGR